MERWGAQNLNVSMCRLDQLCMCVLCFISLRIRRTAPNAHLTCLSFPPSLSPFALVKTCRDVSRVFCEFLEVAIHQILFVRGVYPAEIFERKR